MSTNHVMLDFYKTWPIPVSIKESESGKYLFANQACLSVLGLDSSDQIIGATVGAFRFSQSEIGRAWADSVRKMYEMARTELRPVHGMQLCLNGHDALVYLHTSKSLMPAANGAPPVITTLGEDLSQQISPKSRYLLLRKLSGTSSAIELFLRHHRLHELFFSHPTEAELWVLLAQAAGETKHSLAKYHELPAKVIGKHMHTLRGKVKDLEALQKAFPALRGWPSKSEAAVPLSEIEREVDLTLR